MNAQRAWKRPWWCGMGASPVWPLPLNAQGNRRVPRVGVRPPRPPIDLAPVFRHSLEVRKDRPFLIDSTYWSAWCVYIGNLTEDEVWHAEELTRVGGTTSAAMEAADKRYSD